MIACTMREYALFRPGLDIHLLQVTPHQASYIHAGNEEIPFGSSLQEL